MTDEFKYSVELFVPGLRGRVQFHGPDEAHVYAQITHWFMDNCMPKFIEEVRREYNIVERTEFRFFPPKAYNDVIAKMGDEFEKVAPQLSTELKEYGAVGQLGEHLSIGLEMRESAEEMRRQKDTSTD